LRLTVLGCGTAQVRPETPASGVLVQGGESNLLVDCGPGVAAQLARVLDVPALSAVVVTHLHYDHYLDIVGLRYLLPWPGLETGRPRVYLPPDGLQRLAALEVAISERPGFFADAMDIAEFDPDGELRVGDLRLTFVRADHYVPAWSTIIDAADGSRIVYAGDTGPTERLVETARAADLLVLEATLATPAEDDHVRGHLTADEAVDIVQRSDAARGVLVHYPWARSSAIDLVCAPTAGRVVRGTPGFGLEVPASDGRGADIGAPSLTETPA
jgi:ribonuclease BN (tRNA processing enzyme)